MSLHTRANDLLGHAICWMAGACAVITALAAGAASAAEREEQALAQKILKEARIQGGFVVHLGCGDGRLTSALRVDDRYMVHGLSLDAKDVTAARELFQARGIYGNVTADQLDGAALPYVDNMVNLMVVDARFEMQDAGSEIPRVLAPRGVAVVREKGNEAWLSRIAHPVSRIGGGFAMFAKPVPAEIDEWTHYFHDSTGNAVAHDAVIGPPRHYQWVGGPEYLRHHDHMSGLSAMVSSQGRVFYIIDLGPRWSVQMPPRWMLIARDGFNGKILWQRPITKWHTHLWPLKKGPAQLTRRLVAVDDRVYVTLGVGEPVTALDAATGEVSLTYKGTEGTQEIILADGVLYLLVDPELDAYKSIPRESVTAIRGSGRDWNWDERERRLSAVDAATGNAIWTKKERVAPLTLAARKRRVYYHDGESAICLDGTSGQQVWASDPIPRWKPMHVLFGPRLVLHEDVVLFAGGERMTPLAGGHDTMTSLSAETGKTLWTAPHPPSGYASPEDLLVAGGLVWSAATTNRRDPATFTGRDPRTGEVKVEFPRDDGDHMSHHRCHSARATDQYLLTSRTGIEFVDFRQEHWTNHYWVRGSCNYGIMPCNGLIYAPPHSCACFLLAKLNGLNALAPARESKGRRVEESKSAICLEKGPAYGASDHRSSASSLRPSSWPTYRHDGARSGVTETAVPTALKRQWQTDVGGRLTAPVIAEGKVFVAAIDTHTVHAVDAENGDQVWSFTAGGRVDSPPTVYRQRVLFGSHDGWVYCLRADDGALVWRHRAAPVDQRMMAYEQLESVWPVHGSVLVRDGVVFCVAGRAMWLDGGLRMVRLDVDTGRKLSETVLDDRDPETGKNLQDGLRWPNLPVALPDVLSCDGRHVYMRSQPFDLEGNRCGIVTPRNYTEQTGDTAHLFSPTGFLDDSWWHRTYWMFGRSYISAAGGWHLATYQAPAGRILAVDDSSVYGFGRAPLQVRGTPHTYHLFACSKEPELINPTPNRPPRRQGSSIYGKVIPTRLTYHWSVGLPVLVRAMLIADQTLFVAGPPMIAEESDVYNFYGDPETQAKMAEQVEAFEGRKGAVLMATSKADGKKLAAYSLDSAPVFDGMAAAGGRLFLSTADGRLLCLGAGDGKPLQPAPNVKPGPVPVVTAGLVETKSHPDFQHLSTIQVTPSELGYRIQTAPKEIGLALRKLAKPFTGRVTLRAKVRPRPGAKSPDEPGNGFVAFGAAPADEHLIKCGYRISSKRLYIVQGPLMKGQSKSTPVDIRANEVAEMDITVDLDSQKVAVTMHGQTVEAPLARRLDAITWLGYVISSVNADFSQIEITNP